MQDEEKTSRGKGERRREENWRTREKDQNLVHERKMSDRKARGLLECLGGLLTWYSRDGEAEKTEVGVELQPGAYHSSGFLLCFRSIRLIAIEREKK